MRMSMIRDIGSKFFEPVMLRLSVQQQSGRWA
jgi:hypothetical protein